MAIFIFREIQFFPGRETVRSANDNDYDLRFARRLMGSSGKRDERSSSMYVSTGGAAGATQALTALDGCARTVLTHLASAFLELGKTREGRFNNNSC